MGIFVSFEGSDGCGKTTQMDLLEKSLREMGLTVLRTREPGGTPIGEKIREILLDPANKEMDPRTEAYLYAASRAQHIAEKIRPALQSFDVILCDRFLDSSLVYQGIGRGMGIGPIEELNQMAVDQMMPDLTVVLYLDYEEGLRRKALQTGGQLDRLEQAGDTFHRAVNEGFLRMQELYPDRVKVVDAGRSIEEIHEDLVCLIRDTLQK